MNGTPPSTDWCAAVLDGEGCISVQRRLRDGHFDYRVHITMGMTSPAFIDRLVPWYGGSTRWHHEKSNHKPQKRWFLSGRFCLPLLEKAYPGLLIKKRQAEIAMEVLQLQRGGSHSRRGLYNPYTDEELKRLDALYLENRGLNQKGITGGDSLGGT